MAAKGAAYETLGLFPFLSLENTRSLGRVKRRGGAEATAARSRTGSEPVWDELAEETRAAASGRGPVRADVPKPVSASSVSAGGG